MLKALIRNRLDAMERDLHYDLSYVRDVLDIDLGAFLRFSRLAKFSAYRRDLPLDAWHAAKLAAAMSEDCGPCSQLMVTLAERDGVSAQTLRAVAQGDDAAMSGEVRLAVHFTRAVLAHDLRADALREQVISHWGRRGLLTLGFGMVSARIYPTLKYALGHGRACARLTIAGEPLAVKHPVAA